MAKRKKARRKSSKGKRRNKKSGARRTTRRARRGGGGKGRVPLKILEKRLKKLNSIVKTRKGSACNC